MKPLVNYCRWQGARLRLRGRDDSAVWGQLVFIGENGQEEARAFHFDLQSSRLTISEEDGENLIVLDEMGVPIEQL